MSFNPQKYFFQIIKLIYSTMQPSRTFLPQTYLRLYYERTEGDSTEHMEEQHYSWFHQIFEIIPQCNRAIQIGCGPALSLTIYASRKAKQIVLSQFNVECFKPITQWVNQKNEKYLEPHFMLAAKNEKTSCKEIQDRLRNAILVMIKCDLKKELIFDNYVGKVDLIISSLCLEAVAESVGEYKSIIKNIASYLNPGGYLVFFAVLEETFYMVENQRLPCLFLTKKDIENSLIQNGFKLIFEKSNQIVSDGIASDFKGLLAIAAQKL